MNPNKEPTLSELLQAAGSGSRDAFRQVYARTSAPIFQRLIAEIDDRDVCAELLKDVYVKVWELCHLYHSGAGDPVFWVSMIARDTALMRLQETPSLRRTNPARPLPRMAKDRPIKSEGEQDPAEELIQQKVNLCLAELSPISCELMSMSYREGKGYSEIAAATDGSEEEIRNELARTIDRINDRLADSGIRVNNESGRKD